MSVFMTRNDSTTTATTTTTTTIAAAGASKILLNFLYYSLLHTSKLGAEEADQVLGLSMGDELLHDEIIEGLRVVLDFTGAFWDPI